MNNLLGMKQGHIKIGLPPIMNVKLFIHTLGEFHESYPDISFELLESGSKRIEESIINDEVDVGITVLPTDTDTFHQFFLLEEQLKLVVPRSHKFAEREKVSLIELKDDDFILFSEDFILNDRITEACKTAGFIPKVIAESSQWYFIEQMITASLGVSILPASIIDTLKEDVVSIEIADPSILWQLAIIWKKNSYTSFVTKEWLKFMQEQLMFKDGKNN